MIRVLIKSTERLFDKQPYLETLYKALFITAYYGLFRVSEITKGAHPILAKDVHIGINKNKLLFMLQTSKMHHYKDKPQIIKINCIQEGTGKSNSGFCPYQLLRNYFKIRQGFFSSTEPFFIFRDGSPVKPENMYHCQDN